MSALGEQLNIEHITEQAKLCTMWHSDAMPPTLTTVTISEFFQSAYASTIGFDDILGVSNTLNLSYIHATSYAIVHNREIVDHIHRAISKLEIELPGKSLPAWICFLNACAFRASRESDTHEFMRTSRLGWIDLFDIVSARLLYTASGLENFRLVDRIKAQMNQLFPIIDGQYNHSRSRYACMIAVSRRDAIADTLNHLEFTKMVASNAESLTSISQFCDELHFEPLFRTVAQLFFVKSTIESDLGDAKSEKQSSIIQGLSESLQELEFLLPLEYDLNPRVDSISTLKWLPEMTNIEFNQYDFGYNLNMLIGKHLALGVTLFPHLAKTWLTLADWSYDQVLQRKDVQLIKNLLSSCEIGKSVAQETAIDMINQFLCSPDQSMDDWLDNSKKVCNDHSVLFASVESELHRLNAYFKEHIRISSKCYSVYLSMTHGQLSDHGLNDGQSSINMVLRPLLRFFQNILKDSSSFKDQLMESISCVPSALWTLLLPQIFALSSRNHSDTRIIITELLIRISRATPEAFLLPIIRSKLAQDDERITLPEEVISIVQANCQVKKLKF